MTFTIAFTIIKGINQLTGEVAVEYLLGGTV